MGGGLGATSLGATQKKNYMKKNFLLFFLLYLLFSNIIVYAQWVKCTGFSNDDVRCLITVEDNIYAGTIDKGIFVSSDDGNNWVQTSLNNITIWSLAAIGNTIYTGSDGCGVFQSTDNGITWNQTSLNNKSIFCLVTIGDTILAGTPFSGIYRSTNKGISWSQTSFNNKQILTMINFGNNLYAGIAQEGIYMSTNRGTTWVKTSFPGDAWSFTKIDSVLFTGAFYGGIYLTTNSGTDWLRVALDGITVYSMAASGNNVFAGTYQSGVYLSENRGFDWREINQGLPDSITVKAILIKDGFVFVGTEQGIWRCLKSDITEVENILPEVPGKYFLYQNYPNPFNPSTTIKFNLATAGFTSLKIYNVLGKEVANILNGELKAGAHQVSFDASNLPSGVYMYTVSSGSFTESRKMMLLK